MSKRFDRRMLQDEKAWESVIDSIRDIVFFKDLEGVYMGCNQSFCDYTGLTKEQIIGKSDYDLFDEETAEFYRKQDCYMMEIGKARRNEELLIYPDGQEYVVDMCKSPLIGGDGRIIGLIGVGRDISECKKLLGHIERERQMFDRGPVAVFLWKVEDGWPVEYVSDNVEEILGYKADDFYVEGVNFASFIHYEDVTRVENEVRYNFYNKVDHFEQSYRLLHKDGKYRWFHDYTVFEKNSEGEIEHIRGYIFDQTRIKEMETELETEKERLASILEATDVVTWEWNMVSGVIEYSGKVNFQDTVHTMQKKHILYQDFIKRIHVDDFILVEEEVSRHFKSENRYFECEFRLKSINGDWQWYVTRGKVVKKTQKDTPLLLYGTLSDIHSKKNAQESVRQSEKLAAIGQLAGGVAHDFNNQLMIISGYLDVFHQEKLSELEQEYFKKIDTVVLRSKHLIKQLLLFSKESKFQTRCVSLGELIKDLVSLMEHTLDKNIIIEWSNLNNEVYGEIDPGLVENALINLCLNARDAMSKGGKLKIELDSMVLEKEMKTMTAILPKGSYATISVTDTGYGMNEDTLKHIFEPFFTTKENGTGVGLSTVYGTMNLHQGGIIVHSKPQEGTCFKLYFPEAKQETNEVEEEMLQTKGNKKELSIIVVDDEPLICDILTTYLRENGIRVKGFENPKEALAYFEIHHEQIDLAILDVLMPEMSGYELLDKMSKIKSDQSIVFLSGYSEEDHMPQHLIKNVKAHLEKPLRLKELLRHIEGIID
ncbi:MAG: PAS domain-containing protein [Vallitaleaceae bacterium]|nr:PAS domain-containing protein [Vallitaleaceae bacterium]